MDKVVILAGGRGSRLQGIQDDLPKSLKILPNGRILLELIITNLQELSFNDFYLIISEGDTQSFKDFIIEYFSKNTSNIKISLITEKERRGTGGALELAHSRLKSNFFVVNGDTLFDRTLSTEIKANLGLIKSHNISLIYAKLHGVRSNEQHIFSGFRYLTVEFLDRIQVNDFKDFEELLIGNENVSKIKLDGGLIDLGTHSAFNSFGSDDNFQY